MIRRSYCLTTSLSAGTLTMSVPLQLISGLLFLLPLQLPIIASREAAQKLIFLSDDPRFPATPRTRQSGLLIALAGSQWLTANAETVSVLAQADVAHSTLKGKVTDPSDAAVSGASITVTNAGRGVVRSVKTDDQGAYHVPLLQPGTYELRVEASGFRPQVSKMVLTVGQVAVHDIRLQVGMLTD